MIDPTLLAGLSGAMVVAGVVVAAAGLAPVPERPPGPAAGRGIRATAGTRDRRTHILTAAAAAACLAVWAVSGWPVGGAAAAALVAGIPWLLGGFTAPKAEIARLQALQEWVRRASDVIAAGGGLEQTLIRSASSAPAAIRAPVATLAARLQARWATRRALLAFADDLGDAAGDLAVGALLLGAELRGPGLARVLTELANGLSEEVTARRQIEADRQKPRTNARVIVLITVAAVGLVTANGDYIAPYGTPVGQLALACVLALIAGSLVWMRRLAAPAPTPRFLVDDRRRRGHRPVEAVPG